MDKTSSDPNKHLKLFLYQTQLIMTYKQTSQSQSSPSLIISRTTNHMLHERSHVIAIKQAYLLLGILNIQGIQFVILASDAKIVGMIEGHMIYEITKIEWIPRQKQKADKTNEIVEETQQAITDMIENGGYYFSYHYDLSRSKQALSTQQQFYWNHHLLWQIKKSKISKQFQIPIIQGFVGILLFQFTQKPKIIYALISRKSNKRAGTRFFTRGIDDGNNVANYVETEQLIFSDNDVVSHIGIRGSVPLFWEQKGIDGIQSKLTMTRNSDMGQKAFIGHLQKLKETHNRCFVINLLNKNKQSEGHLTQEFEKAITGNEKIIQDFVKYQYFNFHEICGSNHFERCNPLIQQSKPIIESFGFYHAKDNHIISIQSGIVRTNCLDCLDRTNFIQAKVAITIFQTILKTLDFHFDVNMTENMDNIDCLKIIKDFKILWADNGDMISMHYTGMPSTHTDVTRQGKRTFFGMINHKLKSLGRFYKQFTDVKKQQIINLIHGYTLTQGSYNHKIQKQLRQLKPQYSTSTPLTLMIITWNVQFTNPPRRFFSKICSLKQLPNVVVIGLQNVYKSNKIVDSTDQVVEFTKMSWKKLLEVELVKECGYTVMSEKYVEGSGLFIYFREGSGQSKEKEVHLWDIGGFSTTCINFSKVMDKSSQAILMTKLKIQDSTFLFANFNFDSATDLLEHGGNIHEDAFQHIQLGRQRQQRIESMDYRFLFGNLSSTLSLPKQSIHTLIKRHNLSLNSGRNFQASKSLFDLISHDILLKSKDTHPYFYHYNQSPLHFLPTSSFVSPEKYDQEEAPSYSSRILMYNTGTSIVKQQMYQPMYEVMSVSLPVVGLYMLSVVREDRERKREVGMRLG